MVKLTGKMLAGVKGWKCRCVVVHLHEQIIPSYRRVFGHVWSDLELAHDSYVDVSS